MGLQDEVLLVYRGHSSYNLKSFVVIYRALINSEWHDLRKHCWMPCHSFHTHIRLDLAGNWKTFYITPDLDENLQRALNWSKRDILLNWYEYRRNFLKRIKYKS